MELSSLDTAYPSSNTKIYNACSVSERSRVLPVPRPNKCFGDSDAFATPHLTGYYVHKLEVLNDQGVCLGGSRRGEESQTVDFWIGVPALTILARLHLF